MLNFRQKSSSVVPDTSMAAVTVGELVIRVNVLAQEIARQNRELVSLRALVAQSQTATNGPLPESPASIASGRSGMRYIGHQLGKNEDSIRKALTDSPAFSDLRAKAPDITTNVPLIRWLASPAKGTTELRYSLIAGGFNTAQELAREGGQ